MLTSKESLESNLKKLDEAIKLADRILMSDSKSIKKIHNVDNLPLPETQIPNRRVDADIS